MSLINTYDQINKIEPNEPNAYFLDNYSNISITGKDAKHFLQGQLSCDLNDISIAEAGIGCYCNIKGRIVAYFDIFCINNGYLLNLPTDVAEKLLNALKKYAIFSKVEIRIENDLKTIGIFTTNNDFFINFNDGITKINRLCQPQNTYKLVTSINKFSKFKTIINDQNINLNNASTWKYFLIINKITEVSDLQSEQYLPAELNLDKSKAISFTKGCFMGQEVIARMKYIGKMKKSLQLMNIAHCGNLCYGNKITANEKVIGEIINFVKTGDNAYLALSIVNNEAIENNIQLELENFDEAIIKIN